MYNISLHSIRIGVFRSSFFQTKSTLLFSFIFILSFKLIQLWVKYLNLAFIYLRIMKLISQPNVLRSHRLFLYIYSILSFSLFSAFIIGISSSLECFASLTALMFSAPVAILLLVFRCFSFFVVLNSPLQTYRQYKFNWTILKDKKRISGNNNFTLYTK